MLAFLVNASHHPFILFPWSRFKCAESLKTKALTHCIFSNNKQYLLDYALCITVRHWKLQFLWLPKKQGVNSHDNSNKNNWMKKYTYLTKRATQNKLGAVDQSLLFKMLWLCSILLSLLYVNFQAIYGVLLVPKTRSRWGWFFASHSFLLTLELQIRSYFLKAWDQVTVQLQKVNLSVECKSTYQVHLLQMSS
jgi:hypothetical protein